VFGGSGGLVWSVSGAGAAIHRSRAAPSRHLQRSSMSSRRRAASSLSSSQATLWSAGEDARGGGVEMRREPLGEEALGLEFGGSGMGWRARCGDSLVQGSGMRERKNRRGGRRRTGSPTVPLHNGAIPTAVSTGLCSSHLLAHKGNECNFRASYLGRRVMVARNEFASSFKGCMQPLQYHF
jgi:hypothetical protein